MKSSQDLSRRLVLASIAGLYALRPARSETGLWQSLRGGDAVALMRHALAPGTGDPPDFTLENCTTQRNLSPKGREQARAIGAAFRGNGIDRARVFSSRWCRCLDTAALLGLGKVVPLPALDSFFGERARGPAQTDALRQFLIQLPLGPPVVMVTHQVNITALTAVFPRSGEVVFMGLGKESGVEVLGRAQPA